MSVAENVRIYGGDVVYGDINEEKTYEWDLSEDFTGDINIMWSVCKKNVKQWNLIIGVLGMMEKIGQVIYIENLKTVIKKSELKEYLEKRKIEYQLLKDMIDFLQEEKLVTFFCDSEEENITISYKNGQVKKCLTKAGLVLEMKIYITAKNIIDSDGAFVYDDVVNGAVIDWDSEFHNITDGEIDTENEIDVLMMHGTVPVFISCKNGMVNADELYKLNTVAERFGGENVKKILVATALSSLGGAEKYLRQRAEDMNIKILDDVHMLSDNELEEKIRNLWHG